MTAPPPNPSAPQPAKRSGPWPRCLAGLALVALLTAVSRPPLSALSAPPAESRSLTAESSPVAPATMTPSDAYGYEARLRQAEAALAQDDWRTARVALRAARKGRGAAPASPREAVLEQGIAQASAPVPITLHSDNRTFVSILQYMTPATFGTKRLQLPPGTYAIVGRRNGYFDETVSFTVARDQPPPPVTVICRRPPT